MTWQILPDPFTADLRQPAEDVAETGRSVTSGLFGHGMTRPFKRDQAGDFQSGDGEQLIRSAVGLVLGTVCASKSTQGELPWRTEFGSLLALLRLRNMGSVLDDVARHYVGDAICRWIPSVRIRTLSIVTGRRDALKLQITYDVIDPSGTRVLVPGLETSIPVG